MNTTILQLVAIYNIQLHVSALYVGLYTGPKHVVVYYISLLTNIVVFMTIYIYIYIHYSFVLSAGRLSRANKIQAQNAKLDIASPSLE